MHGRGVARSLRATALVDGRNILPDLALDTDESKCAIHYIARQTGATPSGDVASASELWQRIAAAQERDECPPGLLPNNSPAFATTRND